MGKVQKKKFTGIIKEIIEKSLFTERQIEIILKQRHMSDMEFNVTRGAYYRQVQQSQEKLEGLYYSMILLRGLDLIDDEHYKVVTKLGKHIDVILDSDIFNERERDVGKMIDEVVQKLSKM
ncbi:MAG: hypothetical protein R1F52_03290 [Candidatus Nitrosoabyssus spongiisocia]|nr:MAG: hypothetical protein R1F52_03290 [Nitrosopumilaceae archaeon AB1(1)]